MLDYMEAKKLLDKYGIHSVESKYVESADDACAFASGKKIVMKLISDKAVHKMREGLVKLDLQEKAEITDAFKDLEKKGDQKYKPYKILAQRMEQGGVETIIGGNTDPQFGKIILAGMGGIYVETFKDVEMKLCPITKGDCENMLNDLKSGKVITHNGASTKMLVGLLMKVSKMLMENKNVLELDLNPVMVKEDSYEVVDIRIMV